MTCKEPDCDRVVLAHGQCQKHYMRVYRRVIRTKTDDHSDLVSNPRCSCGGFLKAMNMTTKAFGQTVVRLRSCADCGARSVTAESPLSIKALEKTNETMLGSYSRKMQKRAASAGKNTAAATDS